MKKYPKNDKKPIDPNIFTKYIILVPTEEDKKELQEAFKHIHDSDINTDYVAVNQISHEYYGESIVVSEEKYESFKTRIDKEKSS